MGFSHNFPYRRFFAFSRIVLVLLFVGALPFNMMAAKLYGLVTGPDGKALPFANIVVQSTTKGTTTNEEGYYELTLPQGDYTIVYQYVGYKRKTMEVTLNTATQELDVQLEPEEFSLDEVVVKGDEDPAYAIIRKAIDKREFHLNQVQSYQCKAYTKGLQRIVSAPDQVLGQTVNFTGTLDSNNAGILYLSEAISDFYFKKPDKVKEVITASKVSGNSQTFTWNRAQDFREFNYYQNNIRIDFISDRVFKSPIADNAMMYYKYRLEGFFQEDGKLINKIKVIPKRTNDPVYSGYIYIVEDDWNIHSLDLYLTKANQVKFIDTLWIRQQYAPVDDSIWMPISRKFDFTFKMFGINAKGYFIIVYNDYKVNIELDDKMFSNEVLRIDKEANQREDEYWTEERPVPLTVEEQNDYSRKDEIEKLRESKSYLDSIDRQANKFSPWSILLGYRFQRSYKKLDATFPPLPEWINYNTVEGLNITAKADIWKTFSKERELRIQPVVRYGFTSGRPLSTLRFQYYYSPLHYGYIRVEGGRYMFQYNRNNPISELNNTFYTLLVGQNLMKLYQEDFVNILHRIEVFNGFFFYTGLAYGQREAVFNTTEYSFFDNKRRDITDNNPFMEDVEDEPAPRTFPDHNIFALSLSVSFRPGQKYMTRPYRKIVIESKYPRINLNWRKAIPGVLGSDLNYDYLEAEIEDRVPLGLFGNLRYSVSGGIFVNTNRIEPPDWKHFNGNQTVFGIHYEDGFQILDYYEASTVDKFAEAHLQHNFDGFFFNKIPGIRKLKLQLLVGAHFLYTPQFKDYTELAIGIENIVRVFRVDFVTSFSSAHDTNFGVRVGIDFNQL